MSNDRITPVEEADHRSVPTNTFPPCRSSCWIVAAIPERSSSPAVAATHCSQTPQPSSRPASAAGRSSSPTSSHHAIVLDQPAGTSWEARRVARPGRLARAARRPDPRHLAGDGRSRQDPFPCPEIASPVAVGPCRAQSRAAVTRRGAIARSGSASKGSWHVGHVPRREGHEQPRLVGRARAGGFAPDGPRSVGMRNTVDHGRTCG